jgi:hypothetical protein
MSASLTKGLAPGTGRSGSCPDYITPGVENQTSTASSALSSETMKLN